MGGRKGSSAVGHILSSGCQLDKQVEVSSRLWDDIQVKDPDERSGGAVDIGFVRVYVVFRARGCMRSCGDFYLLTIPRDHSK